VRTVRCDLSRLELEAPKSMAAALDGDGVLLTAAGQETIMQVGRQGDCRTEGM
jgi:hypothetical protein